ncbi:hypothetical protein, partial [Klebsiella pneumoniae]
EWVHVQLHQQKGMISLSPPTICNSAREWILRTKPSVRRDEVFTHLSEDSLVAVLTLTFCVFILLFLLSGGLSISR